MAVKKVGILRFLGTNCDRDIWQAVESVGLTPEWLWYQDHFSALSYGALFLPGGFSYGDYLRCGALAAKAPVMDSLREASKKGVPVLGICNGFQILCESGLLPGALVRNKGLRFIDKWVEMKLVNPCPAFASDNRGQLTSQMPIANGEGCYVIEEGNLKQIQDRDQIWWTYNNDNPNGSIGNIAGVMNEEKNVAGLMPHPERALFDWMGGTDGRLFFESLL